MGVKGTLRGSTSVISSRTGFGGGGRNMAVVAKEWRRGRLCRARWHLALGLGCAGSKGGLRVEPRQLVASGGGCEDEGVTYTAPCDEEGKGRAMRHGR